MGDAQLQVLLAVTEAALGPPADIGGAAACAQALHETCGRTDERTLPQVVDELMEPTEASAQAPSRREIE